ncbi:MAG: lamin tail domain-containing protein [Bacteroidota bacterium]
MKLIFLFFCLAPAMAVSQVWDDFSDGDFTRNPLWVGDSAKFEVNAARQLHLSSQNSDTSVLLTRIAESQATEWRFWMKLSFNTSANNWARICLASDTLDILSAMNGYFLQAGGADDSLFIMKQSGMQQEKLYSLKSCKTDHSTNTLRFKITRDAAGKWEVMVDASGGYAWLKDGGFTDPSPFPERWFGICCRYTSSNSTKFYFDDIYAGPIVVDTIPPAVVSAEVRSEKVVRIGFSENTERTGAENPSNYLLSPGSLNPDSVIMDPGSPAVTLFLHDPMTEGVFGYLNISHIKDIAGNTMPDTLVPVCWYRARPYDVVINEIMADPDPPVGLPEGEFVELYNRTSFPVNLRDWSFCFSSYTKVFPAVVIPPHGYLLVAKDSAWLAYGLCALLLTSSSSLSNEGTTLVLKDALNHIIHSVSYSPAWYGGSFKAEGGWSLELADPSNPCGCSDNWGPAKDPGGGTPGRSNSVCRSNPDEIAPHLQRAVVDDSTSLEAFFSEEMDSLSSLSPSCWFVSSQGGVVHPVSAEPVAPAFISARLTFGEPFDSGTIYTLNVSPGLKDCAGNRCDTLHFVRFAIPVSAAPRDIVINEILSNPAAGGARFVELCNRSEKVIDLQTMVLAGRDTAAGLLPGAVPLSSKGFIIFPGDYIALTSDPGDIRSRYYSPAPESIIDMPGFPVFGDDEGTVILAGKNDATIIDRLQYDKGMHYSLLASTEGVSLERSFPDLPSGQRDNWHSAAETAGFATPGYLNSHFASAGDQDQEVTTWPEVFSPDNDGHDDLLMIGIHEKEPDCAVSIDIYDAQGRLVRHLVNHVLLGNEGVFIWDGITGGGTKAAIGFYILLVEISRPGGTVRRVKKTTVVGGRL